jgi:RNA polymerase sigma factor (sigma-70 family)
MTSDGELLRRYTESNSEDAFGELVRRHLDLVYSAALRQVNGDAPLAQDVAQLVFADLARKAASLVGQQALTGWLYIGAHYAAAKAVRTEQRRHTREQEAHAMQELLHDPGPNPDWETLRPVLDAAMHELNEADREVILLRYFENRRHADIGEQLGLSENAARMKIERTLEKLRTILSRRGITTSAAALSIVLSANAVQAAPVGLAVTISTAAIALAGTTITATTIATHATMNWINAKVIAAVVASVLVAGTAVYLAHQRETDRLRGENQNLRVQQESLTKERDDAVSVAATKNDELDRLKNGQNELLRLRAEVGRLRAQQSEPAVAPASATTQVATAFVEFQGQVVDDQTGKPVTEFALQQGAADPQKSEEIAWGFSLKTSSRWREGRFQSRNGWPTGRKVWLRVLADGYVPQSVTAEPVIVPAQRTNLLVRLKRGGGLQGIVLDHAGRPVAGARVFLAGAQPLDLTDGKPEMFRGSAATTDAEGRFTLSGVAGAEQKVVVTSSAVQVWLAPKPEPGQELKIVLPEPAALVVRYDIPGEAEQAQLRLELKTWEMPEWKGITAVLKPLVPNQGQIMLTNLAPGTYDFVRQKELLIGDMGRGALCDRTTVVLQGGQVQSVDFVRAAGSPVAGEITGLQDAGVAGAFIYVRPAGVSGDPRKVEQAKLPFYEAVTCGRDGQFQTARLAPGAYTIVAEAYRAETPEERGRTGWRLPSHIGTAQVTVSATAAPAPVRIELRPR